MQAEAEHRQHWADECGCVLRFGDVGGGAGGAPAAGDRMEELQIQAALQATLQATAPVIVIPSQDSDQIPANMDVDEIIPSQDSGTSGRGFSLITSSSYAAGSRFTSIPGVVLL